MDRLYIIIPAYNEQDNLEKLIEDWYPIIERHRSDGESKLVVINDGSSDNTYDILCKLAVSKPMMKVLTKDNGGHGDTLLFGYQYAIDNEADYIFQTDSDGQTSPDEFEDFWNKRKAYEAIFGDRREREDGRSREAVERVLCMMLHMIFGVKIPDSNAPFRLMKTSYVSKYITMMPKHYNLPNVMLTVFGVYDHDKVLFLPISFRSRQGGTNSINVRKIISIGLRSLSDFRKIKKELQTQH